MRTLWQSAINHLLICIYICAIQLKIAAVVLLQRPPGSNIFKLIRKYYLRFNTNPTLLHKRKQD